jgi:RNA polymerase-binding transcription factor
MPLTDAQREHLAARLRDERGRVLRELEQYDQDLATTARDAAGDLTAMPLHQADEGTDEFDRQLAAQESTRLAQELESIDAALERLYKDPDGFGRDALSGEDIPFERLDIIPWATTRVDESASHAAERAAEERLADRNQRYAG